MAWVEGHEYCLKSREKFDCLKRTRAFRTRLYTSSLLLVYPNLVKLCTFENLLL